MNTENKKAEKQCDIHVVSESNYPWMINQNTYSVDGIEVKKGEMHKMQKGQRPIVNTDWRKATEEEVITKQWHKGHYFNLMNV